ncbi:MAG: MBL fold metallo-hydrolase [Candidatus Odinarchaeota archaeon]|nr:MBL fold metallo-hydrolase [Candidatus Odinarchaeota archaeon]
MDESGTIHGIPYRVRDKNPPKTRRYFKVLRFLEKENIPQLPFKEAIERILNAKYIPEYSKRGIKEIIVYPSARILAFRCVETQEIFNKRWRIAKEVGWYPYVTGVELRISEISKFVDECTKFNNLESLRFDIPIKTPIVLQVIASSSNNNAYLLRIGTFNILLDCSMDKNSLKYLIENDLVDIVVITHAHIDHAGSIIEFVERGYSGPILMTATTTDYIAFRSWKDKEKLTNFLSKVFMVPYEKDIKIAKDVTITFYRSGHLPGSAMILIKVEDFRFLYTGDFFLRDRPPMGGGRESIDKINSPIDVLLFDSTFGNIEMPPDNVIFEKLLSEIENTLKTNGNVLISTTPGSYDLTLYLKLFEYFTRKGWKPSVYMEPRIIEFMKFIKYRKDDQAVSIKELIEKERDPFSSVMRKEIRKPFDMIKALGESSIIISHPHDLTRPPITNYLVKISERENCLLVLTGAQREGIGKEIINGKRHIRIKHHEFGTYRIVEKEIEIKNRIFNVKYPNYVLASHADMKQIEYVIKKLKPSIAIPFHSSGETINALLKNTDITRISKIIRIGPKSELMLKES